MYSMATISTSEAETVFSKFIDGGLRVMDRERLIRSSGLFDADWYCATYPDVGAPDRALGHYLKTGAEKGYDPGPNFSTSAYLAKNQDVAASGMNALLHYLRFGQYEGRVTDDMALSQPLTGPENAGDDMAMARVKAAFDSRFYRETNPDLPENIDGFEHFMSHGWRQLRDPNDWFSTAFYLRNNGDISEQGINPFSHYILRGCREGRAIAGSAKQRHVKTAPQAKTRLAVVTMVKNEADIIGCFAAHILALFDEIIIVDHGSSDGTSDFLKDMAASYAQVRLLHLEEPSYIQSVTMTHVIRDMAALREVDWVFFLDVDEFLPFATRQALDEALEDYSRCPVISMQWRNLIPETFWQGPVSLKPETRFLSPPKLSPFRKVAFQPKRVPLDRLVVAQGNHTLLETANGLELPAFDVDFAMLHIPIRSADQLLFKLNQGVLAYQKIGATRDAGQGTHWYQMKEATADQTLSDAHLNAMAMDYSEPKTALAPITGAQLLERGFTAETYETAQVELDLPAASPRPLGEMLMKIYGTDFSTAATEDRLSAVSLRTEGDRLLCDKAGATYRRLEAREPPEEKGSTLSSAVQSFFRPSYLAIEDLMPSDWNGHVPFMFSLTGLMRPRRFVEIGTLRGCSVFAHVQMAQHLGLDNEAIAVSSWAVEEGRQAEFANVFEDFQFIASKYPDRIAMLRRSPDQAISQFEDGSIDLLHFDGYNGYDHVARDFEAWSPKLSESGVVLFHDINSHDAKFGVWRLWDELANSVPSLEFRHDQGLGVACIGAHPPVALAKLCETFRKDVGFRTLLQGHFEQMGDLSAELFSRRYDMAQQELRAAAEGVQTEEMSRLRQDLEARNAEIEELRHMLAGGLAHVANR